MVAERRRGPASDAIIPVRLTHKYAQAIDGVDLSHVDVGDRLELPSRDAALLIVEGWAVPCADCVQADHYQASAAPPSRAKRHSGSTSNLRESEKKSSPTGLLETDGASLGQDGPVCASIQQPAKSTKV
jgi:hypothetical protein